MSDEQQDHVWQQFKAGKSFRAVGREVDVPAHTVWRFVQQFGGIRPAVRSRSPRHLSAQEREELSRGLATPTTAICERPVTSRTWAPK